MDLRSTVTVSLSLLLGVLGGCQHRPLTCDEIAAHALDVQVGDLVLTAAEEVPPSSEAPSYPAHCAVTGHMAERVGTDGNPYAIGFELRVPTESYNGHLLFQGGGGTDGILVPAFGDLVNDATNALTRGYAVVSTDGGHATGPTDVTFGLDPQARLDYGYNAVGRVTQVAKGLLKLIHGEAPERSYFVGCSNGGRQAMVAAARFADEFDGILAIDPGTNLPQAALAQAWDTQQFMSAAQPGQLPKDAFPPETQATVAAAVLVKCDALDGLEDGMVHDTVACQSAFDLSTDVTTCSDGESSGCLSVAQKAALQGVFDGARNSAGEALYSDWPWDPGIAGGGWRFWKLDAGFAPLPLNTLVGSGALGYIFTTPPEAPDLSDGGLGYQLGLDFDTTAPKIFATNAEYTQSAMDFMTPPNPTALSAFQRNGGKLIVVHGTADPVFSSNQTVEWYQALLDDDADTPSYARVFLVPGMNHCTGGPATDRFDMLTELESWVEQGVAPQGVIAAVDPLNPDIAAQGWPAERTRPLCAYPSTAVLSPDASDTERADAFTCQPPL